MRKEARVWPFASPPSPFQGYASYSALKAASNSLAEQPAAITAFLNAMARDIRPVVDKEVQVRRSAALLPSYLHAP